MMMAMFDSHHMTTFRRLTVEGVCIGECQHHFCPLLHHFERGMVQLELKFYRCQ